MTPQTFVKEKFPNAKDMYRDEAGHAIRYYDEKSGKDITLSYGSTSAKAWANAKKNILGNKEGTPIKQEQPQKEYWQPSGSIPNSNWQPDTIEKQIAERIAGYIHEIDSLLTTNRELGEKLRSAIILIEKIAEQEIEIVSLKNKVKDLQLDYMAVQTEIQSNESK